MTKNIVYLKKIKIILKIKIFNNLFNNHDHNNSNIKIKVSKNYPNSFKKKYKMNNKYCYKMHKIKIINSIMIK